MVLSKGLNAQSSCPCQTRRQCNKSGLNPGLFLCELSGRWADPRFSVTLTHTQACAHTHTHTHTHTHKHTNTHTHTKQARGREREKQTAVVIQLLIHFKQLSNHCSQLQTHKNITCQKKKKKERKKGTCPLQMCYTKISTSPILLCMSALQQTTVLGIQNSTMITVHSVLLMMLHFIGCLREKVILMSLISHCAESIMCFNAGHPEKNKTAWCHAC